MPGEELRSQPWDWMETPRNYILGFPRGYRRCVSRYGIGERLALPASRAQLLLPAFVWRLNRDPEAAARFHYERDHRSPLLRDSQSVGSGALGPCRLPVRIVWPDRRMGRTVRAEAVSTSM